MRDSGVLLVELGAVLAVLSVLGALARKLSLSPVPLYLLAGLSLGEGGLAPIPAAKEFVTISAEIGVVLLLLALGLEFSPAELTVGLRRHLPSAGVDLLLNATPGAIAGWMLGLGWIGSFALAGVTWISSSGIVARLLIDLRRLGNRETPSVLSLLVLEDIAMAAYLPVLAVLLAGGTWKQAALGVVVAVGAVLLVLAVSRIMGERLGGWLDDADPEQLMLRVFALALLVAGVTDLLDASAAVGAFLVGLALTGQVVERTRRVMGPIRDLFAAAFFVAIGLSIDPGDLLAWLPEAVILALVTAGTKVATGWYAAAREGAAARARLRAGTALIARGEFSIVIAGLAAGYSEALAPLATAYVVVLAITGSIITRLVDVRRIPTSA